ncbi:MAG: hypothetical protein RLY86_4010, partial [Pseudomonadota bacterium]
RAPPWKVVVADDDQAVHDVTELALDGFTFEGRGLAFLHAFSGREAVAMVRANPDAAILLLDVVMEEEHAGLKSVRAIRDELGNRMIRIVLRTGQPGSAPEAEVISRYDINDYKEKSELTARRLFTLMHACLRGYRDIATIERSRAGLARIIDAAPEIFQLTSLERFAEGALIQLAALSGAEDDALCGSATRAAPVAPCGLAAERSHPGGIRVLAATGRFAEAEDKLQALPPGVLDRIAQGETGIRDGQMLELFPAGPDKDRFLYMERLTPASPLDGELIRLFNRNLAVAFENLHLKEEVEETQREIVFRLGEAVETRSLETGHHVKRVAEASYRLGRALGLPEANCDLLRYASPLHDVGKIGVPDHVLNKRGKLDPDEWALMKQHTVIGWRMLKDARQVILKTGATIALQHHERWDGQGYPNGLRGEEIDFFARIVAVVDCVDALGSHRPYKEPWAPERIRDYVVAETGRHFDPRIVAALLPILDDLFALRTLWPDPPMPPGVGQAVS